MSRDPPRPRNDAANRHLPSSAGAGPRQKTRRDDPSTHVYVAPVSLPKSAAPAARSEAKVVLNLPLEPVARISEDQVRQASQRRRAATVKVDRDDLAATTKVADLGIAVRPAHPIADPDTDTIDVDLEATPALARLYVDGAAAASARVDLALPRDIRPPSSAVAGSSHPSVRPQVVPANVAGRGPPAQAARPFLAPPRSTSRAVDAIEPLAPRSGGRAWFAVMAVAAVGGGALFVAIEDDVPSPVSPAGPGAATAAMATITGSAPEATTALSSLPHRARGGATSDTTAAPAPSPQAASPLPAASAPLGAPRPRPRPPVAPGRGSKGQGSDIPPEI